MAGASIKKVLVIGGGGNLGPAILKALAGDSTFTVSILARRSGSSTYPAGIRVTTVDDSYPEAQLRSVFKHQDAIICALSLQSIGEQIKFIDCAVEAGVKVFVPAEFGGNKEAAGPMAGEKLPLHDTKDLVLEHLRQAESKGLSWTAVATGPFIDWGLSNGFLGFDIASRQAKIYGTGDEVWTGTTVENIGLAVARLLLKPEYVRNRFIYIYSVRTTQNQVLKALESATSYTWDVQNLTWEEEIPRGRKLLELGNRAGVVPLILSYFFRPGMGADFVNDVAPDNALLGLSTQGIEGIVQGVLSSI
ncbi:hypothetical protein LTR84_010204 [Exophiala bonariae]|uniref:NmrA-like domain-containing protein n=1 Tax=Exophiala bonariae TaxID=1690606 RepID=A0AAV9MUE9_9EURO|nr:hypothetical protein LTR84_010204 [Exophiala bonariae]